MGTIKMAVGNVRKWGTISLGVVALVLAGVMIFRAVGGVGAADSIKYLSKEITVRSEPTGNEWQISRARLEQNLYSRPGMIDPSIGLPDPNNDGKSTGFPTNKERDWDAVIDRINAEKEDIIRRKKN